MSRFLFLPHCSWIAAGAFLALAAIPACATSVTVNVSGLADLWLAGRANGTTLGGDSAPTNSPLQVTGLILNAGNSLTFGNASGTVGGFGGSAGPDGSFPFNPGPQNSISGLSAAPAGALIGVFLDSSVPSGAAPASLAVVTTLASYSPLLNQAFFVGDGLTGTGSGSTQTFVIPTGATRLFLGIGDTPGGFFNNTGSFGVTVSDGITTSGVPEPGTMATLGLGLLGLWGVRRKFMLYGDARMRYLPLRREHARGSRQPWPRRGQGPSLEEPAQNGLASGGRVRRVPVFVGASGSGLCASQLRPVRRPGAAAREWWSRPGSMGLA